ncbi:hypothetical protein MY3296_003962 [Beauveria thailandica]
MKLLAILAPLALAATSPAVPNDWPERLTVETNSNTWTAVNLTIVNNSPKAFNMLKAGSILDDNRLESMRVGGSPCDVIVFNDPDDRPHTGPRNESEFQLMPAYGNITVTIDLLKVRAATMFCGNNTSLLSTGQTTFHVAEVGSTTLVHQIPYDTTPFTIHPGNLPPLPEAFEERVYKCSPDQLSVLKEGFRGCASQATAAREAALTGPAERMEVYFKDSSQETRNSVADTFAKVATQCNFNNSRVYISCDDPTCWRGQFAGIFRDSDPSHVVFCKRGYFLPIFPDRNEVTSVIHTVIHEMTHLKWVKPTEDWAPGSIGYSLRLDKDLSLENAENYALFSDAVYLKEDGLNETMAAEHHQRGFMGTYNRDKLGDITRSEFLSLAPAVRRARFGFEF